jgi:hypothetical protein
MGSVPHPRNFEQVERGVEAALNNFFATPANVAALRQEHSAVNDDAPKITAGERIEKIGTFSARGIAEACETVAKDIEQAGQAAVDIAADIMREAQELAIGVRSSGKKISEHLQDFAMLAKKVSSTMRDTRAEVLNPAPARESPELAEPQQASG